MKKPFMDKIIVFDALFLGLAMLKAMGMIDVGMVVVIWPLAISVILGLIGNILVNKAVENWKRQIEESVSEIVNGIEKWTEK